MDGYLKDNNGYGIFKSSGVLALILLLDLFEWTLTAMGLTELMGLWMTASFYSEDLIIGLNLNFYFIPLSICF
ncbi:hypothetical protein GRJ2_000500900 [Grus japonensis]|uniref:NADH dehydrogenase subunit 4 n=1 Tax=Grus japonensis TaxID=30415 RepID=A0ABC9W435_GRUJA